MQPLSWFLQTGMSLAASGEGRQTHGRTLRLRFGDGDLNGHLPRPEAIALEARGGIEPPIKVLQTFALPLGDRAPVAAVNAEPSGLKARATARPGRLGMTALLGALARGRIRASAGNTQVHDGRSYQVAPLGPRAVVVANVLVAE